MFFGVTNGQSSGQTFLIYDGDTVNYVDANNLKQGHWIYFGNMKHLPGYEPDQKVEEGQYKDNRKTGLWTKYYPNNQLWSEITYSNNRPNGPYKTYYDNGAIQEEGVWKNNRNIGTFKRYYENGKTQQEFAFSETGKREGKQVYYHENGQVMIEGDWNGGKEEGEIKEYNEDGTLKSVKTFNGGVVDQASIKVYEEPETAESTEVEAVDNREAPKVEQGETKNLGFFNGTGNTTLYNKSKQVSKKGYFKNGRLIDGEWRKYDKNGILEAIEIYKNGRYVGDRPIEDEH